MAFANPSISDIIATTIQNRTGTVSDNVTKNNAALNYISKSGNVKTVSGGNTILQELSFAENTNASWYTGYETLPVGAQDVISAAEYQIKQMACAVTISGLEMLQNAGKEQIIDLLEARISVAESTLANRLSESIYSDGTQFGGKELTGLKLAVSGASTGTYGGINRVTFPFWRNQTVTASATLTATTIQAAMNSLYAKMVRGADKPNVILFGNNLWTLYLSSLQAIQRFNSSDSAAAGFSTIKYMNSDVVLDGGVGGFADLTPTLGYFLNTKYLLWRPMSQRNMVPLSPGKRYSINQDAETQLIAWAGNLTTSNSSLQGLLTNV